MANPQSFIASGRDLTGYTKWLVMFCIIFPWRDRPRKHQVVRFDWLKPCVSQPSNMQERQHEPAKTILPNGPDIPADPTLDGTVKDPILPAMPGVLDEGDDYSDDDGPELPVYLLCLES